MHPNHFPAFRNGCFAKLSRFHQFSAEGEGNKHRTILCLKNIGNHKNYCDLPILMFVYIAEPAKAISSKHLAQGRYDELP